MRRAVEGIRSPNFLGQLRSEVDFGNVGRNRGVLERQSRVHPALSQVEVDLDHLVGIIRQSTIIIVFEIQKEKI